MLTLNTPLEETVAYKELVAIGEIKGIKKGREEGLKKAHIEVASKMLRQGFDHKTICELTGIDFDEPQTFSASMPACRHITLVFSAQLN